MKRISPLVSSALSSAKNVFSSVALVIRDTFLTDDAALDRPHIVRLHPAETITAR